MNDFFKTLADAPLADAAQLQTTGGLMTGFLVTLLLSGLMLLVYRSCHDALTYNRKFNITLLMLAVSSTALLALVQSNPLFALGALGAFSLCRIRINTRDPRDLGFVFWSLTIGVSSALGAFSAGLAGTVVLSLIMSSLGRAGAKKDALTMVIRGQKDRLAEVQEILGQIAGSTLQAKNLFVDSFELVYELRLPKPEEKNLLTLFNNMPGIHGVNILAPQTELG